MTTPTQPLDIGKLKEDIARIVDPYAWDERGPGWKMYGRRDDAREQADAIVVAIQPLILMAERVERLKRLVERAQLNVPDCYTTWHEDARNALSPKPEISDPTKRMEKILGAKFERRVPTTTEDQHG